MDILCSKYRLLSIDISIIEIMKFAVRLQGVIDNISNYPTVTS